jgi:hypothetical protein
MNIYIYKAYAVVVGAPKASYEAEYPTQVYANAERANRMLGFWTGDQGRRDSELVEVYLECPVVDGAVYLPSNLIVGA